MEENYLNPYPTIKASCEWLQKETGKPWTLPLLLKHGLRPWFWLDNQDGLSEPARTAIFNGRTEGYFAEMCFAGDIARLTTDTSDVVVTITRTADGKHMKLRYPGLRFSLDCLRFLHADIAQLANKFSKSADAPAAKVEAVRVPVATQQNDAIINWLKVNQHDPLKLPVPPSGKAGVKKICRDALCKSSKQLFSSSSVFDTAWERLRANTRIMDASTPSNPPIKSG